MAAVSAARPSLELCLLCCELPFLWCIDGLQPLSKCSCHVLHPTDDLLACSAGVRLVHFSPARCLAFLCATGIARLTAGQINLTVTHTYLHVRRSSISSAGAFLVLYVQLVVPMSCPVMAHARAQHQHPPVQEQVPLSADCFHSHDWCAGEEAWFQWPPFPQASGLLSHQLACGASDICLSDLAVSDLCWRSTCCLWHTLTRGSNPAGAWHGQIRMQCLEMTSGLFVKTCYHC